MNYTSPKFSVIIPAYNEEKLLPRLLDSIAVARKSYSGGANAVEVIVADNDSTDRTAAVAAEHGAKVLRVTKRRIAAARGAADRRDEPAADPERDRRVRLPAGIAPAR